MISEFEQRLADVLGARLPAPFAGQVKVPPGPTSANQPVILVGVEQVECVEPFLGSQRPEVVPGAPTQRRVLRLQCQVNVQVKAAQNKGRPQQMSGLDALLYILDAPDFRDGSALVQGGDPGFVIHTMQIVEMNAPLDPSAADALPVGVTLRADGLFWPVGVIGETGVAIGEVRIRGVVYPLEISPAKPSLVAGGPAVELTVRVQTFGTLRRPATLTGLPFGQLAFTLRGPGGRPGSGALAGSTDGVRLVSLADGAASVTYTPPAEAAVDELVIALDDGEGGLGMEVGRFPLVVREAI